MPLFRIWIQLGVIIKNYSSKLLSFSLLLVGWLDAASVTQDASMQLHYDEPAQKWLEALPVGNGFLGGMLFGGVEQDRIQLNEDTLWSGYPHDRNQPGAVRYLPEIRQMIFEGKTKDAAGLVTASFMGSPAFCAAYQPMTDLIIETPIKADQTLGYSRRLDLQTAVHTTRFEADGVQYTRETFSSNPDQAIFIRLSADQPGNISCKLSWKSRQPSELTVSASGDVLKFHGQLAPREISRLIAAQEVPGLRYAGAVIVNNEGGTIKADGEQLVIDGADAVTLQISAATSFVNADAMDGDEVAKLKERLSVARHKTYDQIKQAHIVDHQSLMLRTQLSFPETVASQKTTDERINRYASGDDEALAALLFNYGRYLLIASSRPGSQPANLQGIWNDSRTPPWGSKYTININAEMNYWMSGCANLAELQLPLFDMIEQMVPKGRETAKQYYGARGWWRIIIQIFGVDAHLWMLQKRGCGRWAQLGYAHIFGLTINTLVILNF